MRGRFCTQPFLVERSACHPNAFLLPLRWVSRSPPHPPQCAHWGTYGLWWLRLDLTEQSPGLFDPRGEGFGGGCVPFRLQHPPLPARPAGGRAVTGVRYRAAGQAKKEGGPPQGPPNQKRWVQGGRTSSSLVFFPPAFFQRKPGPRPGPGGQRGAAPRGRNEPRTWRVRSTAPHPHPAGANLRRSQKGPPTDSRDPRPHLGPLGPPNVFGDIRQRP